MRLEGRVAVVTGAAQGIGNAIEGGLAAEGARIVIADLYRAEAAAATFRYVNPEDAEKPKLQRATVFFDHVLGPGTRTWPEA